MRRGINVPGLLIVVLAILTCHLQGCSGGMPYSPGDSSNNDALPLLQLPAPGSIAVRSASKLGSVDGAAFETAALAPALVSVSGTAAQFQPDWQPGSDPPVRELAYALYAFDHSNYQGPQHIELDWSSAPAQGCCWIGLGNQDEQRWVWFRSDEADIDDVAPYLSDGEDLYVVVAVCDTLVCVLDRFHLNLPPFVSIATTPSPPRGVPPLAVEYDASGSMSFNGAITRFEWDFDGDGEYDLDSGVTPATDHTFDRATECDTVVRITDEAGIMATGEVNIRASGIQTDILAEGDGDTYVWSKSMAIVNGHPAICYESDGINYIRAKDKYGTSWHEPVKVQNTGGHVSMCIVDGHPAIAFGDEYLYYIRAGDPNGESWGERTEVDTRWLTADDTWLAVVDGKPAVTYFSYFTFRMYYVRAEDSKGTSWGTPVEPDTSGLPHGTNPALIVAGGKPVIGYWERINLDLYLVRADDATGTAWLPRVNLDGGPDNVGAYIWMANLPYGPGISYYDNTNQHLKFVPADSMDGSSWLAPLVVDGRVGYGQGACLEMVGPNAFISYLGAGSVWLVQAGKLDGTAWDAPDEIFSGG